MHNLTGESLDVVLRGIDDRQPFLQFRQIFVCGLRLFRHGLADAAGHTIEPFADRLIEFGLP